MARMEHGRLATVIFSLLRSAIVLILLTVVAGIILYFTDDPMAYARMVSLVVLIISGGISAFLNVRMERRAIAPAIISTVAVAVIMAIISLVAGGGISVHNLLGYLAYIAIGVLTAVFSSREKRRRR